MFNLFKPFDLFRIGYSANIPYNPLINYDWSTTTTSGLRYLKDVGSTPTYDASMYFGRGAYLNGVDQYIPFTLNLTDMRTVAVRLKREVGKNIRLFGRSADLVSYFNFDLTFTRIRFTTGVEFQFPYAITEGIQVDIVVTNISGTWYLYENTVLKSSVVFTPTTNNSSTDSIYRAANEYSKGIIKDLFVFNRGITTAEKDSYTNTPELFYAMAQADNTCVLNMPMCETDGYVRNMKSYSLGNELAKDVGFDNSALWRIGDGAETLSSIVNGILHFKGSTGGSINILNADATTIAGEYYEYEVVISEYTSGGVAFGLNNYYVNNPLAMKAVGTYKFILQESVSFTGSVRLKCAEFPYDMKISSLSVKKLSGTYPITNYTSSVRDNAKNLQYGLQTCKFVRDSLGVVQSASDYLECNGTGYAIIPSHADSVNIKMTVNPTSLSGNLLSGGVTKTLTGLTLNVDNDVVISNVTPTGTITLASGFSGTIKTYTEELS